jgi:hypothetical protein
VGKRGRVGTSVAALIVSGGRRSGKGLIGYLGSAGATFVALEGELVELVLDVLGHHFEPELTYIEARGLILRI